MFADKTQSLIRLAKSLRIDPTSVIVVKPIIDTRCPENKVESHAGESIPAIALRRLMDMPMPATVITVLIDEGQFFDDLAVGCLRLKNHGINVGVWALNGTTKQTPWPAVSQLIPYADVIELRHASCYKCHAAAVYTELNDSTNEARRSASGGILIGGANLYRPVCFKCKQS
jgi:thymidine kinase